MAYLLSRLIIFIIWTIKWVVIKSRLLIPALFVAVVLIFFQDWYNTNEVVANGILAALVAIVAVSWIITIINKLKYLKRQHKRDVAYAYKVAGEPIIATKKVK